jgi:cell wall-associated NlpC family hydrolase
VQNNPVNFIDPWGLEFISPEQAQALLLEFQTWLGTPYRTGGIQKGKKGGTDCSHSTHEGYKNAGFPYRYSSAREFAQNPMFRQSPDNLPQIGDVALWSGHMAVYAGDGRIYTAHRPGGAAYSLDKLSDWTKSMGTPVWYRYYRTDQ